MKFYIAGARGSIPSPSGVLPSGERFRTDRYGANTTSIYLESDRGQKIILDAGTGIVPLGRYLVSQRSELEESLSLDLFFTHTHWDHIQGFPFFVPAYIKGNKIDIYGEAKITGDLVNAVNGADGKQILRAVHVNGVGVKDVLADQQKERNFPVPLNALKGLGTFYDFIPGGILKEDDFMRIETKHVNHPGGCVSYKIIEKNSKGKDKVTVICTDFEPDHGKTDAELIKWWEGADLVYADAQYETGSERNNFMKGWGHSDPLIDLEFARKAGVKRLLLGHHDPKSDDQYLQDLEYRIKVDSIGYSRRGGKRIKLNFAREGSWYNI